jgi:carbon-monoxide dehydrogenase small subunit
MKQSVSITVNGAARTSEVEPRLLLVHYLRETLGLTGTHVGCDTSQCGACTVLIDGQAVKSCTVLAVQADGASVATIEGMAKNGELHRCKGLLGGALAQCGFCAGHDYDRRYLSATIATSDRESGTP